jgi:hypothetical protein
MFCTTTKRYKRIRERRGLNNSKSAGDNTQ